MSFLRLLGVASVAVVLVGCPELAMKGAIRSLAAPGNPGSVHVKSGGDRVFKVSWVDPLDGDVASIEISFSTPFATNAPPAPVNVPLGVQSATVSVPLNNVWYFITVRAVDSVGNKSAGVTPVNIVNFSLPYTVGLQKYQYDYNIPSPPGAVNSARSYFYDSNGNVTQENYFSDNLITQYQEVDYTYDSRGNVLLTDYYPYSGGVKQAENQKYTYQYDSNGNLSIMSYFSGTPPVLDSQTTYEYDSNGNVTKEYYNQPIGTLYSTTTYSYDGNGNMVTRSYTSSSYSYSTTYEWDPATHFISKWSNYDGAGASQGSTSIQFNAGALSVAFYDSTGASTGNSTLYFDANGLQTSEIQVDQNGVTTWATENQYDLYGRQIEQNEYNGTPAPANQSNRTTWSY